MSTQWGPAWDYHPYCGKKRHFPWVIAIAAILGITIIVYGVLGAAARNRNSVPVFDGLPLVDMTESDAPEEQ